MNAYAAGHSQAAGFVALAKRVVSRLQRRSDRLAEGFSHPISSRRYAVVHCVMLRREILAAVTLQGMGAVAVLPVQDSLRPKQ